MKRNILVQQLQEYKDSALITHHELLLITQFTDFIAAHENCFHRSNSGHITSGVWVINAEKTHALLTHHKKFDIWCQLGGHNDGNPDCKATAIKEAEEESGITGFTFLHEGIFDIDLHPIPGSCAYHYDVRYLLQAPMGASYIVSPESHDLAWVALDKIPDYSTEASVLRMNEKFIKLLKKNYKNS